MSEQVSHGTALVTGGAIRLGKAIALALADTGYNIALHYNSSRQPALETAAEICERGVTCEIFQQDLSEASQLDAFLQKVHTRFPDLNVLVNSASGYAQAPITETTLEIFDSQMNINLRAPFFLTQAFAKHSQQGNIINILDNKIGYQQYPYAAYLLAKKALVEFTKMAALEFAPTIRINGVAPGVVMPMKSRTNDYIAWRIDNIPLKMQGTTQHITRTITHILDNDFVTGQIFVVDGGEALNHIGKNAADYPGKI